MWIERHITRKVFTIEPQESVIRAKTLMASHCIRHLPVVDDTGRVIGIISDRDVRGALPTKINDCIADGRGGTPCLAIKIEDIMTRDPSTISPEMTLQDVLLQFRSRKVGAFPVVDADGRIAGILSDRDLMNAFIQMLGLGNPGAFIAVAVGKDERQVGRVVDRLIEAGFPIASMLVIREWSAEQWAVFLYLLSQNLTLARHALEQEGATLIDPLQWLMAGAERPAA